MCLWENVSSRFQKLIYKQTLGRKLLSKFRTTYISSSFQHAFFLLFARVIWGWVYWGCLCRQTEAMRWAPVWCRCPRCTGASAVKERSFGFHLNWIIVEMLSSLCLCRINIRFESNFSLSTFSIIQFIVNMSLPWNQNIYIFEKVNFMLYIF